ncbi:MAG TPA: SAF domain-containing protein [Actinomycetes bacterium]|nr:SAF domain-containing protein [Actinomycetes bacterium]
MAGWEPDRHVGPGVGLGGRYGTGGAQEGRGAGQDRWLAGLVDVLTERRRWVIAALVAGSVGAALYALAPPDPASRAVLAAARDLAAGAPLAADDVTAVRMPAGAVPSGALTPGTWSDGLLLTGPIRRGEVLTDVRTLGPDLLDALAAGSSGSGQDGIELVATPVRLADPGTAELLRTGQLVDVLAAAPPQLDPISGDAVPLDGSGGSGFGFGSARVVAAAVRVIAVPAPDDGDLLGRAPGSDGPLIVLATTSATAATLAAAATSARLSVVIRARAPP